MQIPLILNNPRWRYACLNIVILILTVQLSGCSRVVYHFADWIIVKQIDKYLDLNDEQQQFAKQRVDYHLNRIELEEFPLYINLFKDFKSGLHQGLDDQTFERLNRHYQTRVEYTLQQLSFDIGALLATLSDKQLDRLERRLLKENRKAYEHIDYTKEKRKSARQKAFIKRVKNWYGKLSKEQRQKITTWYETIPDNDHLWYQYANNQIKFIIKVIRSTDDPNIIANLITDYWFNRENYFTDKLEQQYQQQLQALKTTIIRIDSIMSDKQKQHAMRKLDRYIELLEALHQKNFPPTS